MKENDLYLYRYSNWINYIAPNLDPKKMKRNIQSFMPLKGETSGASEELRERGRKAMLEYEQYLNEINGRIKC